MNIAESSSVAAAAASHSVLNSVDFDYPPSSLSPACRPVPYWADDDGNVNKNRIFFAHQRKAGGTYLRRMLKDVTSIKNWTLVVREGSQGWEDPKRNDTIYVTNLRHPVSRIISDYKYEGRWDCGQLMKNRTFLPSMDNSKSLEEFIDRSTEPNKGCGLGSYTGRKRKRLYLLWKCSELCYLRLFGGKEVNCYFQNNVTYNYETALQRLSESFHLIVITEWLHDLKYRQKVLKYLGLKPYKHYDSRMYCDKSKWYNHQYPALISNETLTRLHQMNQLDIRLYETLTSCTAKNLDFPVPPSPQ